MDEGEEVMAADPLMSGSVLGRNVTGGSTNSVDMEMARMNPPMLALYEPQVAPHFSGTPILDHMALLRLRLNVRSCLVYMSRLVPIQDLGHHQRKDCTSSRAFFLPVESYERTELARS